MEVIHWAKNRLGEDLSVQVLADRAGYSLYHFSRLFSAIVGETPKEWVQHQRITLARERLQGGRGRIIDVAMECGFHDAATFTRAFRRETGQSPQAFRLQVGSAKAITNRSTVPQAGIVQDIREERCRAFDLCGLSAEVRSEPEIPGALWARLFTEFAHRGLDVQGTEFRQLATWQDDAEERFTCFAGFIPDLDQSMPLPFVTVHVPESYCLVFRVQGPPDQLPAAYQEIYGLLLPSMPCRPAGAFAFERYSHGQESLTEICLPIRS